MKRFYWRTLLLQTIFYGLLMILGIIFPEILTKDGNVLWTPVILIFYTISVIATFIIPMFKLYQPKIINKWKSLLKHSNGY